MGIERKWVLVALALAACLLGVPAGAQSGLGQGSSKAPLGAVDGRLAPPSLTPNSVSSQADLYPEHPQRAFAKVEPFSPLPGESMAAAWERLVNLVRATPGVSVMEADERYLRAEAVTRWLGFTDDIELLRADSARVIHVRSASRVGHSDLGANRKRVEQWRAVFNGPATSQ